MTTSKKTAPKKTTAKKPASAKASVRTIAAKRPLKKTTAPKKSAAPSRGKFAVVKAPLGKSQDASSLPSAKKPKAGPKKLAVAVKRSPSGFSETLRDEALKILDDRQGENILTIDLLGKSSVADYLIIASGRSARQISAMAHYLREVFMKNGIKNIRVEGASEGNWALVDGGDVIVHLFRPEVRSYYDLESIWDKKAGAKPQENIEDELDA